MAATGLETTTTKFVTITRLFSQTGQLGRTRLNFRKNETSDIAPVSSKEVIDIQSSTECEFTLKRLRDMIRI